MGCCVCVEDHEVELLSEKEITVSMESVDNHEQSEDSNSIQVVIERSEIKYSSALDEKPKVKNKQNNHTRGKRSKRKKARRKRTQL